MTTDGTSQRRPRKVLWILLGVALLACLLVLGALKWRSDRVRADFGAIHEGMSEVEARKSLESYNLSLQPDGSWQAGTYETPFAGTYHVVTFRVEDGKLREVRRFSHPLTM